MLVTGTRGRGDARTREVPLPACPAVVAAAVVLAGAGEIPLFAAAGGFTKALGGLGGGAVHPGGAMMWTMLSHFGQMRICPMADSLKTFSLA
jgi:hypothetical protein